MLYRIMQNEIENAKIMQFGIIKNAAGLLLSMIYDNNAQQEMKSKKSSDIILIQLQLMETEKRRCNR